ncbi:hypothetical protein U1Q18_028191, partial [Sarracenia purpurea var. burkii]
LFIINAHNDDGCAYDVSWCFISFVCCLDSVPVLSFLAALWEGSSLFWREKWLPGGATRVMAMVRGEAVPLSAVLRGGAFYRLTRVPAGGDRGADAELASNPVTASDGRARSATGAPAVLTIFEDARLGAELIGMALADWDAFMLRDLLPNSVADHYW